MELTNDPKNSNSPEEKKPSTAEKKENTNSLNNTQEKSIVVDDVELNEEQLDIISGGGEGVLIKTGG